MLPVNPAAVKSARRAGVDHSDQAPGVAVARYGTPGRFDVRQRAAAGGHPGHQGPGVVSESIVRGSEGICHTGREQAEVPDIHAAAHDTEEPGIAGEADVQFFEGVRSAVVGVQALVYNGSELVAGDQRFPFVVQVVRAVDVAELDCRRDFGADPGTGGVQVLQMPQIGDVSGGSVPCFPGEQAVAGVLGVVGAFHIAGGAQRKAGGDGEVSPGSGREPQVLEPPGTAGIVQGVQHPGVFSLHVRGDIAGGLPAGSVKQIHQVVDFAAAVLQAYLGLALHALGQVRRQGVADGHRQLPAVFDEDFHAGGGQGLGADVVRRGFGVVPAHQAAVRGIAAVIGHPVGPAAAEGDQVGAKFSFGVEDLLDVAGGLVVKDEEGMTVRPQGGVNGSQGQQFFQQVCIRAGHRADGRCDAADCQGQGIFGLGFAQRNGGGAELPAVLQQHGPVLRGHVDVPGRIVQLGDFQVILVVGRAHQGEPQQNHQDGHGDQGFHQRKAAGPLAVSFHRFPQTSQAQDG